MGGCGCPCPPQDGGALDTVPQLQRVGPSWVAAACVGGASCVRLSICVSVSMSPRHVELEEGDPCGVDTRPHKCLTGRAQALPAPTGAVDAR